MLSPLRNRFGIPGVISARVTSASGAIANPVLPFRATDCAELPSSHVSP